MTDRRLKEQMEELGPELGIFLLANGSAVGPSHLRYEFGGLDPRVIRQPVRIVNIGTGLVVTPDQNDPTIVTITASGGGSSDPLIFASNTFANADTTPDVSAGSRWKSNNGSATVITNFDAGANGQLIFVTLDANTSIQQNANIDTAASGPGLVAYLLDGTVWRYVP